MTTEPRTAKASPDRTVQVMSAVVLGLVAFTGWLAFGAMFPSKPTKKIDPVPPVVMAQPNEPNAYVLDYGDVYHLLNERENDRSDFTGKRVRFWARIVKIGVPGEVAPCGHVLLEHRTKNDTAVRCDLRCGEPANEWRIGDLLMFIGSPEYGPLGGWLTDCKRWKE
jgi:hypothetical protein